MAINSIFIPYNRESTGGVDLLEVAEQWQRVKFGDTGYLISHLDDDILSIPREADESIYILGGHGKGNTNYVYWPSDVESNRMYVWEYADRFMKMVPKDVRCQIEVYSCYSGYKDENAFGYLFAEALWDAGYDQCRIFGYTLAMSQYYMGEEGKKEKAPILKGRYPVDGSGVSEYDKAPGLYGQKQWWEPDLRAKLRAQTLGLPPPDPSGKLLGTYARARECRVQLTPLRDLRSESTTTSTSTIG